MAGGLFGRGSSGGTTGGGGSTSSEVAAPAAAAGGLTAFIDQGSEFEGKLSFKDTVRIDGHFRGEITSENTLVVGASGEVEATIRSRSVVIAGRVEGQVIASDQLVLHKTAVLDGDAETASLIVENGAVFNGRIEMKVGGARSTASLTAIHGGADASDERDDDADDDSDDE